ncbi:hypothetical protein ACROYT_G031908 [Oculina patagonica]
MSSSTIIRWLLLVVFVPRVFGQPLQFGRESFPVDSKTLKCTSFTFPVPFTSSDVHVHVTIHNNFIYEAAVGWVEDVTQTGFTGCVVASGPGISTRQLSADWMAFQGTPPGTQTGSIQFPLFTTGTRCWIHVFMQKFESSPIVHVTAVHKRRHNKHDAMSVWVEDITNTTFKACFREIKNFDGIHTDILVDWVAMTTTPSGWSEAPESTALNMPNTGSPPAKFNYGFCQNVSFAEPFFKPPCIITTVAHQYNPHDPLSIPPSKNALTEWTECLHKAESRGNIFKERTAPIRNDDNDDDDDVVVVDDNDDDDVVVVVVVDDDNDVAIVVVVVDDNDDDDVVVVVVDDDNDVAIVVVVVDDNDDVVVVVDDNDDDDVVVVVVDDDNDVAIVVVVDDDNDDDDVVVVVDDNDDDEVVGVVVVDDDNDVAIVVVAVSVDGFSVCVKDIQALDAMHTPVTIQFIALGHLDPCNGINCPYYATCKAKSATEYECVCDFSCPSFEDNLCSAQGITYGNECEYKKGICLSKKHVGISHPGSCKPFVVQRGFASLDMSADEMKCSDIVYNSSDFYSLQPVHILLSINHGGQTNGLVHDPVNTWAENVGEGVFTACAMKSGRLEHDGPLPPDYGLASLDWVAFQGSPRGALVGIEQIDNWWEGTTCKLVTIPPGRFTETPSVLLTAKHAVANRKRDSATLWTEDVTKTSFQICIRELQNFDGHHKNISVSWLAFEYLPRNTFAEFESIYFPNGNSPMDSSNHAFCQNVTFKVNYMKKPAVMISATHNSSAGLLPDFNSITAWIESIDNTGFKVCMKELHLKSVYDPVSINWVTMPECNSPLGVGMYKRRIPGDQMTASSQISKMYMASLARLNNRAFPGVHYGAWCALNNTGQWLQIDLGYLHVVTGVATQGRNSSLHHMWVKTYELSFSKDGKTFEVYKENNITQVFNGNSESNMMVVNGIKETQLTRYVRFLPITWYGHVCMRVEVYGCEAYTEPLHVMMMSSGCDDPPSNLCGDSSITIDGFEMSPKSRGHNVVAVDQEGSVIEAKTFDTYGDSSAGTNMANFITSLPDHTVVLIAVHESGNVYVGDAADALKSLGATEPLNPGYRGSWVLVGYKGTGERPAWVRQAQNDRYLGPTVVAVKVFE